MSVTDGIDSLSDSTNKAKMPQSVLEQVPELELEMNDSDLLKLSDDWERKYAPYEAKIKKLQDENENYWLGKQHDSGS